MLVSRYNPTEGKSIIWTSGSVGYCIRPWINYRQKQHLQSNPHWLCRDESRTSSWTSWHCTFRNLNNIIAWRSLRFLLFVNNLSVFSKRVNSFWNHWLKSIYVFVQFRNKSFNLNVTMNILFLECCLWNVTSERLIVLNITRYIIITSHILRVWVTM